MKNNESLESIIPISRRNVMKAGAVTAVGVGLFSGIAAATNAKQINFCGCSQLCVDRDENPDGRNVGGVFVVYLAKEDGEGGWEFDTVEFGAEDTDTFRKDFCYEPGDPWKIIAVGPRSVSDVVYCNPGQCAQKALEAAKEEFGFECRNVDEDGNPAFGNFRDIIEDPDDPTRSRVEIVHGRCGQPGRTPPGQDR